MTPPSRPGGPPLTVVDGAGVPARPLGDLGTQQVLLGAPLGDASPLLLGVTRVNPGHTTALIVHDTDEVAYVVAGHGQMATDHDRTPFRPGDAIHIPTGCWHAIAAADEPVVMVYLFPGPELPTTRSR